MGRICARPKHTWRRNLARYHSARQCATRGLPACPSRRLVGCQSPHAQSVGILPSDIWKSDDIRSVKPSEVLLKCWKVRIFAGLDRFVACHATFTPVLPVLKQILETPWQDSRQMPPYLPRCCRYVGRLRRLMLKMSLARSVNDSRPASQTRFSCNWRRSWTGDHAKSSRLTTVGLHSRFRCWKLPD